MLQDVTEYRTFPEDRWDQLEPLGRGGQGTTVLARSHITGELAALKKIHAKHLTDFKQLELFFREGAVLRTLTHPGIPQVLDVFTVRADDEPAELYIAQTYFDGEPLSVRMSRGVRPSTDDVTRWTTELLEILTYLHSRVPPVYHRDIKPSNVIIRPDGSASLIDFGAVATGWARSDASTMVGTPGFSAPEQFAGIVSPKTDLFALGATLWSALTGLPPVPDYDTGRLLVPAALPDQLKTFIGATTALDPSQRPPSAKVALRLLTQPTRAELENQAAAARDLNAPWLMPFANPDEPDFDMGVLVEPPDHVGNPFVDRWLRLPPLPRDPSGKDLFDYHTFRKSLGLVTTDGAGADNFWAVALVVVGVALLFVGSTLTLVAGLCALASALVVGGVSSDPMTLGNEQWAQIYSEGDVVPGLVQQVHYDPPTAGSLGECKLLCRFAVGPKVFADTEFKVLGEDAARVKVGDFVPVLRHPDTDAGAMLAILPPTLQGWRPPA